MNTYVHKQQKRRKIAWKVASVVVELLRKRKIWIFLYRKKTSYFSNFQYSDVEIPWKSLGNSKEIPRFSYKRVKENVTETSFILKGNFTLKAKASFWTCAFRLPPIFFLRFNGDFAMAYSCNICSCGTFDYDLSTKDRFICHCGHALDDHGGDGGCKIM